MGRRISLESFIILSTNCIAMELLAGDEEAPDLSHSGPKVVIRPMEEVLVEKYQEMLAIYREKVDLLFVFPTQRHDEEVSTDQEPITLAYQGDEKDRGVCDVMGTESETINKVLAAFSFLIGEARSVRKYVEREILGPLAMYGERPNEVLPDLKEGDKVVMIGQTLGFFKEVFETVNYCNALAANIVAQLYAVYRKKQPRGKDLYNTVFKAVRLHPIFASLGEVLGAIAMIDSAILSNPTLAEHWDAYKGMVQRIKDQGGWEVYGLSQRQERQLRKCLFLLDQTVISARNFASCLNQRPLLPLIEEKSKEIRKQFVEFFLVAIERVKNFTDSLYESDEYFRYLDLVCLYALFCKLFPSDFDEDLYRYIWALQRKVPLVVISGLTAFYPHTFLETHCPVRPSLARDPKDLPFYLTTYLTKRDEALPDLADNWYEKFKVWSTHMDSFIMTPYGPGDPNGEKYVEARGRLVLQGVLMGMQVKSFVQMMLALHLDQGVGFQEENIPYLLRCIELLKAIQDLLHQKEAITALSLNAIQRLSLSDISRYFRVFKEKHYRRKNSQFDFASALQFAQDLLSSPMSPMRLDIVRVLVSLLGVTVVQSEKGKPTLEEAMWKSWLLVHLEEFEEKAFDCSFIYWCKDVIGPFIQHLYSDPCNIHRFKYLFSAFEDASEAIQLCRHQPSAQLKSQYAGVILGELQEKVLKPLAAKIEEDLRYHTHSVHIAGITKTNPMEKNTDYSWFLEAEAFSFSGHCIEFRQYVEDYLDEVFYNLSVLNLTDWKMYEEMRTLAWEKYRLSLSQVYLPWKTHDQGLDLLQLSKNLNGFVMEMKYNQLGQFFMQPTYEQISHVQTFSNSHVVNSLRTHGLGTIHTVINNTYRLLSLKFEVLTSLMKDDYMVSKLMSYRKWYKQHGEAIDQLFPYDKAVEYAKSIKQLGRDKNGETFLDKFRKLVTHIGNAVGIIRMVKGAVLNIAWTSCQLLPRTSPHANFQQLTQNFSSSTQSAAQILDQVLLTMSHETDYFTVLVRVLPMQTFQQVVKTTIEQRFLSNFFIAVPALTLSFVETMMLAKNKLLDRKAFDMYFSVRV